MPNATLNSFSDLTQGKASQIRNCANEQDLRAWFEALFLEKFDGQDERTQKAWAWRSTVGRKYMLREGASEPFHSRRDVLASGPRWIRDAIEAGKPLSTLSLAPVERELFSSIFDWMRSPSGPSLTSDWSKISTPQAKTLRPPALRSCRLPGRPSRLPSRSVCQARERLPRGSPWLSSGRPRAPRRERSFASLSAG